MWQSSRVGVRDNPNLKHIMNKSEIQNAQVLLAPHTQSMEIMRYEPSRHISTWCLSVRWNDGGQRIFYSLESVEACAALQSQPTNHEISMVQRYGMDGLLEHGLHDTHRKLQSAGY